MVPSWDLSGHINDLTLKKDSPVSSCESKETSYINAGVIWATACARFDVNPEPHFSDGL